MEVELREKLQLRFNKQFDFLGMLLICTKWGHFYELHDNIGLKICLACHQLGDMDYE